MSDQVMSDDAVEVHGVSKTFTVKRGSVVALEGIDLTVARGGILKLLPG